MFGKTGFLALLASGMGESFEAGELSRSQVSNDLPKMFKSFNRFESAGIAKVCTGFQ